MKRDTTLNIRDVQRNLKSIADKVQRGASFMVFRNSKPIMKIVPIHKAGAARTAHEAFRTLRFKSKKGNLSQRIDDIVYGL